MEQIGQSAPNVDKDHSPTQKELRDKLAWSVGTTLNVSYGKKSPVMAWAELEASRLVKRLSRLNQPDPNNEPLIEGPAKQTYVEWAVDNPMIQA